MAVATPLRVFALPNSLRLAIGVGDITKVKVDAIVNAANERMLGGGGVDGAIHRAAGRDLYEACLEVPEVRRGVRCPTGEARITPGFDLPAPFVIHTVGPVYQNDHESQPLLQAAHRSCLDLASREGLASIAFPALSCGVYGYPIAKAARVAVKECIDFGERAGNASSLKSVDFVLFSKDIYDHWVSAAEELVVPAPNAGDAAAAAAAAAAAEAQPPMDDGGGKEGTCDAAAPAANGGGGEKGRESKS